MPLAKASAPKSAYDYDQEHLRDECKSPEIMDKEVTANMKALRLLDQTQVRSPKEAERNYSSNMAALKLLDELASGDKYKTQPTVPSMDLSPKQYSGQEDMNEGDDILEVDNFNRYKSQEAVVKEDYANRRALYLIDQSFGGAAKAKAQESSAVHKAKVDASKQARGAAMHVKPNEKKQKGKKPPPLPAGPTVDLPPKEYTGDEDIVEGDQFLSVPVQKIKKDKSSEAIRKEKVAAVKALRLIDKSFGGQAAHYAKSSAPNKTKGLTMKTAAADSYVKKKEQKHQTNAMIQGAKTYQQETRPKKLVADKRPEDMATTTRKKKLTPEDVRDPETVAGMKCELDHDREKWAEKKALKLVYYNDTNIV